MYNKKYSFYKMNTKYLYVKKIKNTFAIKINKE